MVKEKSEDKAQDLEQTYNVGVVVDKVEKMVAVKATSPAEAIEKAQALVKKNEGDKS